MLFSYCIQLCIYFHWCKKDFIYWSFEDEAELHMLCKDSQIAKRKKKRRKRECGIEKASRVFSVACVLKVWQSTIPPFSCTSIVIVCLLHTSSSCAYLTGEETDIALCSSSAALTRFDKSVCHLKQKGKTHFLT